MEKKSKWVWLLFVLFIAVNSLYLGSVPGLMGDEGSEGENVYQLLQQRNITLIGERSYIGPMIDYVRIPFVLIFGYNTWALRAVMLAASALIFWLALGLAEKAGLEEGGLVVMAVGLFSPIYLLYQRLGWAITLIPFFLVLIIAIIAGKSRHKWWWVGIAIGVGLSNHIIFAATAVGLGVGMAVIGIEKIFRRQFNLKKVVIGVVSFVVGLSVGFGGQAIVLLRMTEDQGDPMRVASLAADRWQSLPQLLPMVVSGSSFMAAYTGTELTYRAMIMVTIVVVATAVVGLLLNWRKSLAWAWGLGTMGHLAMLMVMIDRFSLRYFVVLCLSLWAMSGWGLWTVIRMKLKEKVWAERLALGTGLLLSGWMVWQVGWMYAQAGGANNEFSVGNRNNNAIDLVRTEELVACVTGAGRVYVENVHIYNRLVYLSRGGRGFTVMSEEEKDEAQWIISYRLAGEECGDDGVARCEKLKYFCFFQNQDK